MMKFALVAVGLSLTLPVQAASFGDDVAACAVRYELPPDSPELGKVFTACEQRVAEARRLADRAVVVTLFKECLQTAARGLDDRTSPASDIAKAVAFSCRTQWRDLLLAEGASARGADQYPSAPLTDASLHAVLENRTRKR